MLFCLVYFAVDYKQTTSINYSINALYCFKQLILQSETDVEKKDVSHGIKQIYRSGIDAVNFVKDHANRILNAFHKS